MKMNIGLVTSPALKASLVPISNLLTILTQFSSVCILTGNNARVLFEGPEAKFKNVQTYFVDSVSNSDVLFKMVFYIYNQLRYSYHIFTKSKHVDKWIFFIGCERMFLPVLTAHFLKKPILLLLPGSAVRDAKYSKDSFLPLIEILSAITKNASDKIIVYSQNLIVDWHLENYSHKIHIAHEHLIDLKAFSITTAISDRPSLIGYIGRLSGEKGIINYSNALKKIFHGDINIRSLIGGDGELRGLIEESLMDGCIAGRVDLPGWISHDELPKYLNQLRLLVLPSYTEGLPNIMLEAMACGTPVLATPVGVIPDIIEDEKTGFIMENNSSECIADNILRALNSPELEAIGERARQFVEENYSIEKATTRWKEILVEL